MLHVVLQKNLIVNHKFLHYKPVPSQSFIQHIEVPDSHYPLIKSIKSLCQLIVLCVTFTFSLRKFKSTANMHWR